MAKQKTGIILLGLAVCAGIFLLLRANGPTLGDISSIQNISPGNGDIPAQAAVSVVFRRSLVEPRYLNIAVDMNKNGSYDGNEWVVFNEAVAPLEGGAVTYFFTPVHRGIFGEVHVKAALSKKPVEGGSFNELSGNIEQIEKMVAVSDAQG